MTHQNVSLTRIFAMGILLSGVGCSSNRVKTLALMGGSAIVVGTVAALVAPADEQAGMNALLGGALAASGAGVAGLYLFDEEKRANEFERQNDVMRKELGALRDEGAGSSSGAQMIYQSSVTLEKGLPPEFGNLVRPGQWSVYRLDHWVNESPGTMIHQDKMVRLIPAQLAPGTLPQSFNKDSPPTEGRPGGEPVAATRSGGPGG